MTIAQYKDQDKIKNLTNDLMLYVYTLLERTDLRDDEDVRKLMVNINRVLDQFGLDIEDITIGAIGTQYEEGMKYMDREIKAAASADEAAGLLANLSNQPNVDALIEMQTDAMLDLKAAIRTAKISANNAIYGTLEEIKRNLQIGTLNGMKRDKITQMVADTFAREGMTSFITRDGRNLPLDFYAEVTTRTHINRAASHGAIDRYAETGQNLFTVSGGDPTCADCAKYRGRVFTMDPEDDRFPYLDPYTTFPVHPQCKCVIRPYVEKFKTDQELIDDIAKSRDFDPDKVDPRYTEKRRKAYEKDQAMKRKARQEMKQYNQYKAILGDEAPKTLGAFRRMKRNNTKGYKEIKSKVIKLRRADTDTINN
jgi:hypothetical protein